MIDTNLAYEGLSDLVFSNNLEHYLIELYGEGVVDDDGYLDWDLLESESQVIDKLMNYLGYSDYILESDDIILTIKFK